MQSKPGRGAAGASAAEITTKRVILSMGGKGGVGKTSIMASLTEWYAQIGGLAVATFITVLLVPVFYSIAVLDLKIVKWDTARPAVE